MALGDKNLQDEIRKNFYLELYKYIFENNVYENFKIKFTEEMAYEAVGDVSRYNLFKIAYRNRSDDKAKKSLYNKMILETKIKIKPVFKDCAWYGLTLGNSDENIKNNILYLKKMATSDGAREIVNSLIDKAMTLDLSIFAVDELFKYINEYEKDPLFFRAMKNISDMVNCESYQMSEKFSEFFEMNEKLFKFLSYVGKIIDVYGNPLSIYFPKNISAEELAIIAENSKIENIINKYHDQGMDYSEMLDSGVQDKSLISYCEKYIGLLKKKPIIDGLKILNGNTINLNGFISQKYFTDINDKKIGSLEAIKIIGSGDNIDNVLINDYTTGEISAIDRYKLAEYDLMIKYCNENKSHLLDLMAKMRSTEMRFFPSKNEYFVKIKEAMTNLEKALNCEKSFETMGKAAANLYRAFIGLSSACREYIDVTESLKKDDRHQIRFDTALEFKEFINIKEINKLMYF